MGKVHSIPTALLRCCESSRLLVNHRLQSSTAVVSSQLLGCGVLPDDACHARDMQLQGHDAQM